MEVTDLIKEKTGLTFAEIAEKMGVSAGLIYNIREGRYYPSTGNLLNICVKLGVSADYLLGLSPYKGIRR